MTQKKDAYYDSIKQIGVLTTVPVILLAGPAAGFFLGGWIDRQWHSYPWFTVIFIGLGFTASAREVIRLLKGVDQGGSSDKKN